MSNKKGVNINISGGRSDFGNIVQGDKNKVISNKENALDEFFIEVSELKKAGKSTQKQVDKLREEVNSIINSKDEESLVDKAKQLYESYSWAIEPLKKLFAVVLP